MPRSLADAPVDRLAGFIAGLRYEALPGDVVAKTKIHVADTLAAGLAGARSPEFRIACRAVRPGGEVPLWGTGDRACARDAALLNGIAAHAFELDDSGGCDHSGAVVVPAVLAALCEVPAPVDGKRLIASIVAGYDAGRRILEATGGYDSHNGLGWHSTGTCGTLAAAAAVANLLELGPSATREAITLATSFSSGLWAFIHDGSQAKKVHAGRAAEGGLLAASLAAGGFTGPSKVFDDVWGGFFRTFDKSAGRPELLAEDLGTVWKIKRAVLKPYASCRGAHAAIDALEDLLAETGRDPEQVETIEIGMSAMLMGMCGARESGAMAPTQMSLPYALAARCLFGTAGLEAYAAARRADRRVHMSMERMKLAVDDAMQPLDAPLVTLVFKDGRRLSRTVPHATGSVARPMPSTAVEAKFHTLAAMSLTPEAADRLWSVLADLQQLDDCRLLGPLLQGAADRRPTFQ